MLFFTGCYYDNEEELYPSAFCDVTNVTFAEKVSPIIQANCALPSCHAPGGTGDGDFTQFGDIQAAAANGSLVGTIKHQSGYSAMPVGGSLSDCDILTIETWVQGGAINN